MLILNEIYENTKNLYHLKLVCGNKGLSQIMSWVYVTEDMQNADFLKGSELVITTGMNGQHSKDWLYLFISKILQYHPCGIIVNTGKYIMEEDITIQVRDLCESHDFPLFIMPWSVHISDITHDYYDRIFYDNLDSNTTTEHFLNIIKRKTSFKHSLDALQEKGFLITHHYCICILKTIGEKINVSDIMHHLMFFFENNFHENTPTTGALNFHIAKYENCFLLIFEEPILSQLESYIKNIIQKLQFFFPRNTFYVGISPVTQNMEELSYATEKASTALSASLYQKKELVFYHDLKFLGLLSLIKDHAQMKQFEEQYLGPIISYDAEHGTDYLITLRFYIECNGSIQEIADQLFCHRNTINNRIRMIKNIYDFDINDINNRYQIMTAFYIQDYFKILAYKET